MSRAVCYQCRRAKVACLCGRIEKQPNKIKVIVLQHPDEVSNPKASCIIAELGLQLYQRWSGEDFSRHPGLNRLLDEYLAQVAILYPSINSVELHAAAGGGTACSVKYLIVIDATWRKAKKIWSLCPRLQKIPAFKLPSGMLSNYRIRKQPEAGYLSTLESIVAGLRLIECRPQAYQPLLDLFAEMIDFQINKMGVERYTSNYLKNKPENGI